MTEHMQSEIRVVQRFIDGSLEEGTHAHLSARNKVKKITEDLRAGLGAWYEKLMFIKLQGVRTFVLGAIEMNDYTMLLETPNGVQFGLTLKAPCAKGARRRVHKICTGVEVRRTVKVK